MIPGLIRLRLDPFHFRPAFLAILLLVLGSSGLFGVGPKQAAPAKAPAASPTPIMHWIFDNPAPDIAGNRPTHFLGFPISDPRWIFGTLSRGSIQFRTGGES